MDDGLQNPSLAKDVRIVVLDGRRGVGNGAVIPAGPLRAPLGTQLERADAVLVLGDPCDSAKAVINAAVARNVPVLQVRLEPDASSLAALRPQRMMAYAGIASPDKFFATLAAAGIEVAITRGFADHHPYTEADAAALIARATAERLALVTTEKDHVRLRGGPARLRLAELSAVLPVRVVFQDDAAIRRLLARVTDLILRAAPGAAASAPPRG
jgi:tetraacyldisaccharide 4'-kinase